MFLYLLFFSFMEKRLLYIGLENSFTFSPFDCAISDVDYAAMFDDKTVLFSESTTKKIILTILVCKQWPWNPHSIVIKMIVYGGYRKMVSSIRCLKQIISDLVWKQRPPRKPPWFRDDLQISERRLKLSDELLSIYILIQYIWHQNISLKAWIISWKRRQHKAEGLISLLYGDILTIVENWSFQSLFLMVESIHWILNRRIYLYLNWNKTNVIQQRESVVIMRQKFKIRKKINRVDTLLIKDSQGVCIIFLISLLILFVVFTFCVWICVICL